MFTIYTISIDLLVTSSQMSCKILCLTRSYQSYALRFNHLPKLHLPTKTCANYCGIFFIQSHSGGLQNVIFISHRYSTSSTATNSINAIPNEHSIQKNREKATDMHSDASSIVMSTIPLTSSYIKNGQTFVRNKVNQMYQVFDRFSHTNEIREAHEHVERLQEELISTQQKRRDLAKQLNDIRYDIQVCYGELASCQKGESRYLELVRKEYEIHHREKQLTEEFNLLDKAERDLFIHLQAAVKTSHEKEKIHTNSAKYWSIVGSLIGALLGICGTAFSFYNRNNMITTMLTEVQTDFVRLRDDAEKNRMQLHQIVELLRKLGDRDQSKLHSISDAGQSTESWLHWMGRTTYVISAYRYFVPRKD